MVCPKDAEPPFSEQHFYRRLSLLGQRLGLAVFVFFPHRLDWERERVVGYVYSPSSKRWEKRLCPFPDAVYDRCFYANARTFNAYREPIRKLMASSGARFLGRGLKGKWTVHQMMVRDEALKPHIPETERLQRPDDIVRWLDALGELFLKPHGGSQGKGVLHIAETPKGFFVKGRTAKNEPVRLGFRSRSRMLRWVSHFVADRRYLIQRYLTLTTAAGEAFDIRALVQKNGKGRWELTGMAVRLGAPGSVTSNLHGGGRAEEVEPFLRRKYGSEAAEAIIRTASDIAQRVPVVLEQYHGRLAELGVDLGVDGDGHIWVLEANSKPGRSAFAALADERVRLASIRNPMLYAKYLLDSRSGPARLPACGVRGLREPSQASCNLLGG